MTVITNTAADPAGGVPKDPSTLRVLTKVYAYLVGAAIFADDGNEVTPVAIVDMDPTTGVWSMDLEPNTGALSGTYYRISEPWAEWDAIVVPATGGPIALSTLVGIPVPPPPAPTAIPMSQKGAANGVATLGSDSLLPWGEFPEAFLAAQLADRSTVIGAAFAAAVPGLIMRSYDMTGTPTTFTTSPLPITNCSLTVPPTNYDVVIRWKCMLGINSPGNGQDNQGAVYSLVYETTGGVAVPLDSDLTYSLPGTPGTSQFAYHRGETEPIGPSTTTRTYGLYVQASREGASSILGGYARNLATRAGCSKIEAVAQ